MSATIIRPRESREQSETKYANGRWLLMRILSEMPDLAAHLIPELLQLLLADDTCVTEPAPVWLNPTVGQLLGLVVLWMSQSCILDLAF